MLREVIGKRGGASTVEFALIAMLVFILFFAIIDAARLMWAMNGAAKATHWGARYAVVNDPVAQDLADFDCLPVTGGNGLPCPVSAVSPNPVICTESGCNAYGPKDDDAFDRIVAAMRRIDSRIQPANVRVEYRHVGLGFSGNPFGADIVPTVTVKLQGMAFTTVTPGLTGFLNITLPDFRTTLTGEDLRG